MIFSAFISLFTLCFLLVACVVDGDINSRSKRWFALAWAAVSIIGMIGIWPHLAVTP